MEEIKISTISQLMSKEVAEHGITEEVKPENVVKLPYQENYGSTSPDGILRWDAYATRVDAFVCIAYVYSDGRVTVVTY